MSLGSEKKTMKTSAAGCLYFFHLVVVAVSGEVVTGSVNDILTLPCTYTVYKFQHPVCWGRGECPVSSCDDEIIRTDGLIVTRMKSDRYQLLGNINEGNMSLTISGVTKEDEGTYCCRVEIPGLFNDKKTDVEVTIREVDNAQATIGVNNPEPDSTTARTAMYNTCKYSGRVCFVRSRPNTRLLDKLSFTTRGISDASKVTASTEKPSSITTAMIAGVSGTVFLVALMGVMIYICKYRNGKTTEKER